MKVPEVHKVTFTEVHRSSRRLQKFTKWSSQKYTKDPSRLSNDPLHGMSDPMTRSRTKKMLQALNQLIEEVQGQESSLKNSSVEKAIHVLSMIWRAPIAWNWRLHDGDLFYISRSLMLVNFILHIKLWW